MKNYIILILTTFLFNNLNAQLKVTYSQSELFNHYDTDSQFHFTKNNEILIFRWTEKYVVIQKFDSENLNLISEKKQDNLLSGINIENIIETNGKYYYFFSVSKPDNKPIVQLFFQEIDFNLGEIIGSPNLLFEVNGDLTRSPKSTYSNSREHFKNTNRRGNKFDVLVSKNKSKILVQYRKARDIKRDVRSIDIMGFYVYDEKLTPIWSKEYEMPYTERVIEAIDYKIISDGSANILIKVFNDNTKTEEKKKQNPEANYHIELLSVNGGVEIKKSIVKLENKYINSLSLFELSNNQILCSGYFNNGTNYKNLNHSDGYFWVKIKNNEILSINTSEIPKDLINQYNNKNKTEFLDLIIKEVEENSDGSILIISEQCHKWEFSNPGTFSFRYYDLFITKLDKLDNLLWMRKLPKRQRGNSRFGHSYEYEVLLGDMSYYRSNNSENQYFIFLDNVKNKDLDINEEPDIHVNNNGGFLTLYAMDSDGNAKKQSVFDTKKIKIKGFSINHVIETNDNEFVMEFNRNNKENLLVKLKID
jgi:hypothetical protein